jgi:hypothetical protein
MKKVILSAAVLASLAFSNNATAQLIDEQNVTVTMDLQPILQLGMNGSSNVDFVFDQIPEYIAGITQYGATQLMVTSTVNWDLYAVGFSSNAGTTGTWDQQVIYGAGTDINAQDDLPLTALELHQDKQGAIVGTLPAGGDYSAAFVANTGTLTSTGDNNVYCSGTPYTAPAGTAKYIAGHNGNANFMVGGTYLVLSSGAVGAASDFYYSMDYRIIPGLPAVFPNASLFTGAQADGGNNGTTQTQIDASLGQYAQSGVYTMNVKYVLMENN